MEFIWDDGGRAASGFVGITGDCVTRAIAIATGTAYRAVYAELGKASNKSPRKGIPVDVASEYLTARNWTAEEAGQQLFCAERLPKGVVIVHLGKENERSQHLCTVVDHVIYDTWNAADDDDYLIFQYWVPTQSDSSAAISVAPRRGDRTQGGKNLELTQKEFDKILRRLKALDNTASNSASTEGEKRNALRMMQALMVTNNLTRDDIAGEDNVQSVRFTRMTCLVNGRRAAGWEKLLASYVCDEIFPSVQWYMATRGHRTVFTFYGPLSDVSNTIALFRELLLTIASAAQLQYGGYTRGSAASYAEGYVAGLPRSNSDRMHEESPNHGRRAGVNSKPHSAALVQVRTVALQDAARQWLRKECNIRLTSSSSSGRHQHDPAAANRGKIHGAKQSVGKPSATPRLTSK